MQALIGNRLAQRSAAGGADIVVAGFPIPAGGSLNQISVHMTLLAQNVDIADACFSGITGYVCPVEDPDAVDSMDDIWDLHVPKDTAIGSGVLDLDTGTPDTTPEFEIGEADWAGVFGSAPSRSVEIFKRRSMHTFPDNPIGFQAGTPDVYHAAGVIKTQINRKVRVASPSIALLAVSSPDVVDAANGGIWSTPTLAEWNMLQYVTETLREAWKHLVGLVATGTQEMAVEAATWLEELLEGTIVEGTAGAFVAVTWSVFCRTSFNISVPGDLDIINPVSGD